MFYPSRLPPTPTPTPRPRPPPPQLVIEAFAKLHRLEVPPGARPCLWDKMRQFLDALPDSVFAPDEADGPRTRSAWHDFFFLKQFFFSYMQ